MELADYGRVLIRRWKTIVALTVLGIIASVVVTALTPKSYASEAKLFVGTSSSNAQSQYAAAQFTLGRMSSYLQLNASGRVLRPVIRSLKLNESVQGLAGHITLTNPAGTVTLDVTAMSTSPGRASDIANAVANQLSKVIESLEKTDSASGARPVTVSVTQSATPQSAAVAPRPTLNVALGLISGLVLGMVLAIVRDQFDSSVRSTTEATKLTRLTVLGAIQRSRRLRRRGPRAMPPDVADEVSRLRANVALASGTSQPVTVLSAAPGDGRSTVAIALAIVSARSGLRTCLVEADLHEPSLRKWLRVDASAGLADVLSGSVTLDAAVVDYDTDLSLLVAGSVPAGVAPDALLDRAEFDQVLDVLTARYDAVIVDVPPTDSVSDGLLVARRTGAALLVARPGTTGRDSLATLAAAARGAGVRVGGLVINCASRGSTRSVRNFLPVQDPSESLASGLPTRPPRFVAPDGPGPLAAAGRPATAYRPRTRARMERHRIPRPDDQDSARVPL